MFLSQKNETEDHFRIYSDFLGRICQLNQLYGSLAEVPGAGDYLAAWTWYR